MTVYEAKQNDTRPRPDATLRYSDGSIPDLTGASVKFLAREMGGDGVPLIDASATITDVPTAAVEYVLTADDTAEAGSFYAEWEVTFADGTVQTFPTRGFDVLLIGGDIS